MELNAAQKKNLANQDSLINDFYAKYSIQYAQVEQRQRFNTSSNLLIYVNNLQNGLELQDHNEIIKQFSLHIANITDAADKEICMAMLKDFLKILKKVGLEVTGKFNNLYNTAAAVDNIITQSVDNFINARNIKNSEIVICARDIMQNPIYLGHSDRMPTLSGIIDDIILAYSLTNESKKYLQEKDLTNRIAHLIAHQEQQMSQLHITNNQAKNEYYQLLKNLQLAANNLSSKQGKRFQGITQQYSAISENYPPKANKNNILPSRNLHDTKVSDAQKKLARTIHKRALKVIREKGPKDHKPSA